MRMLTYVRLIGFTAGTLQHRQSLQEKLRELGIRRPGREPVEAE